MNANYTTRTATLKTVKHDSSSIVTNKLFIRQKRDDGQTENVDILDLIKTLSSKVYLDDREGYITENDLWGELVESDESTVKIQHKWLSGNSYCINNGLTKVIAEDNKIQDKEKNFYANVQFNKLVDGTSMFTYLDNVSLDCNFDNLEMGDMMFEGSKITNDTYDLPKLSHGYHMYYATTLPSNVYSKSLDSLISGDSMFDCASNLNYFYSNIPYCCTGYRMFNETGLYEFRGATTYLYDGRDMFKNTNLKYITSDFSSLVSGLGMFENTNLSISAIELLARSLPSLNTKVLVPTGQTDEYGNAVNEYVGLYENGVSFKYNFPIWDASNKLIKSTKELKISSDEIGIITITWKDPVSIPKEDALIIEREYFKLLALKGWTIVTNLRENENGTQFSREINGSISVGTLIIGPKAAEWQEITNN